VPELPEVELLRRDLAGQLPSHRIVGVEIRLAKVFRSSSGLGASDLLGSEALSVTRRAKNLLVALSGNLTLAFHLRLSGQLVLRRGATTLVAGGHPVPRFDAPLPHKSTHLIFALEPTDPMLASEGGALSLYYTDIRQFGFCHLMHRDGVAGYLEAQSLGPDALDSALTLDVFATILRRRPRAKLKALLLDQVAVAGLGNIYADEALYLSRLHPLRTAGSLDVLEVSRLYAGVRETLVYALEHGVAEVSNGRARAGVAFPRVHGREDEPCGRCATPIRRIRVGGRSTYFCPSCQPGNAG
jgi:formamidopyrimidine-DNA glycosylase